MFVGSNLSSQTMSESPLREIYVSTDIETDGPVAGKHSMLSIGSAAYLADKELLGTFSANLETLPASVPDPKTAAWWATQPQAWSACRQNPEAPAVALKRYVAWLKAFGGRPVFVGYPAAFDFSFVYWYLTEFAGENPFGYSAIDIKTYAMALLRQHIERAASSRCPRSGSTPCLIRMWRLTMPSSKDNSSATCLRPTSALNQPLACKRLSNTRPHHAAPDG